MKTTLQIHLHKTGHNNNSLTKIVASHNEGLITVPDLKFFENFVIAQKAEYPTMNSRLTATIFPEKSFVDISEDGESNTCTIDLITHFELNEQPNYDALFHAEVTEQGEYQRSIASIDDNNLNHAEDNWLGGLADLKLQLNETPIESLSPYKSHITPNWAGYNEDDIQQDI